MHIPDGVLSGPVIAATTALAAGGVAKGLRKLDEDAMPRVGLLAAVFFIAGLVRVPVAHGLSSAHLVLAGFLGLVIGWAAFPAVAAALLLQAVQFGCGGVWSLGANTLSLAVPAVAVHYLLAGPLRAARTKTRVFGLALAAGAGGIALATLLVGAALCASGEGFLAPVVALLVAHVPVAAIEGLVTGWIVTFLWVVRPQTLCARGPTLTGQEG